MRLILAVTLILTLALLACGNEYHPEYHPVTATTINQTYSSPVSVESGPWQEPEVRRPAAAPVGPPAPQHQVMVDMLR